MKNEKIFNAKTLFQRKNRRLADLLVGKEGLEPSSREALVPKTSVSTNCTTYPIRNTLTYLKKN